VDYGRIVESTVWLVHIIIFMLIAPPIKPFVNDFFICLDKAWGMFFNNDEVIWALKYIAMSNALAFKSYLTSILRIHWSLFLLSFTI
jgi:hypothetical protein